MALLSHRESNVTVVFFVSHFPPKPRGSYEPATAGSIRKFHFRNAKTCMSASINIDLDQQTFPWNFVAHLSQSSPSRTRPERCELFRAQLDLAFFAMAAPTDLKRQRPSAARLSQANLSAGRLGCQITLLDNKTSKLFQIVRQAFFVDQKFQFNFAIVSRSIFSSPKVHIVNAMRSVSRLSRVGVSSEF
jgi:hypothetical protein